MRFSRNIVLLLCAVVVTITSIGMNSFSLFLRPIEAGFGWSRTMVTVPYMFGMLGWGGGAVLFGKLADDLGARRVILGGILLMAAGFVGISRVGSASDVAARVFLKALGLEPDKDVAILQVGGSPERAAAFRTGRIAGFTSPPGTVQLAKGMPPHPYQHGRSPETLSVS